jgi:hypothetical protein
MLPNFLIAGAAKAGTTSLWFYMNEHPQIGMASIKEPSFFSTTVGCGAHPDGKSPRTPGHFSKGLVWYESLFQDCNGALAVGEASTQYMSEPESAGLIKKFIPDVKLIFLLRDPVSRIYSHYLHERHRGWTLPPFEEMVKQRHPAFLRYLYVSSYHLHLERYSELFPREQLLVYLHTDLISEPERFVQGLYRELAVDPNFVPANLGRRYNPARSPRLPGFQRQLERAALLQRKYPMLRTNRWISRFGQLFVKMNSIVIPRSKIQTELRGQLIDELSESIEYAENWLEHPLPKWRQITP